MTVRGGETAPVAPPSRLGEPRLSLPDDYLSP
jgi:hypothetical protein